MVGLKDNLHAETVGSLPLRETITIPPETNIQEAISKMREKGLGCAVIVDASGRTVGIFTERSVINALMQDAALEDLTVSNFADRNSLQVKRADPIRRVWDGVLLHGCRFICVTDDEGHPVGVTGHRGLAEYVSEHFPRQVMVQRLGCKPSMQQREGA